MVQTLTSQDHPSIGHQNIECAAPKPLGHIAFDAYTASQNEEQGEQEISSFEDDVSVAGQADWEAAASAVREHLHAAVFVEIDKLSDEMNKAFAREQDTRGELYRGMLQGAHVAARVLEASAQRPIEEPKQSEGDTTDHLVKTLA